MTHYLKLVFFLQFAKVSLQQACYTQCLQDTSWTATSVNVMAVDGGGESNLWLYARQWYDRKTAEFNALYPAISVTLSHVEWDGMVAEALLDLDQGTNLYHAHVVPYLNFYGGTSRLSDRLMDMSEFTVDNVNNIEWSTIGRFFRSHGALYEKKVLTLPLAGDFTYLYYRRDLFMAYGMTVPRTLEEYVVASQIFNNTDLNGDGDLDYGSCFPHVGELSDNVFFYWVSQVLQYRGTSQGSIFDTETLAPLLQNPAVQQAVKLWKEVAGPPEMTRGTTILEMVNLWYAGRCAMTLFGSSFYQVFQNPDLDEITGVAMMPGFEKVWWREGNETVKCNTSFCRHATQYPDGVVVNHAPPVRTIIDGAINGQIDKNKQLAAFTYLTWLMSDANMLEAVVNPPSWPNGFPGTFVKPSLLVPSVWTPYGWRDPALSMVLAAATSHMDHTNAYFGVRLPNAQDYYHSTLEILIPFWRGTGEYKDIGQDAGAVVVSARLTTALQEVTAREDREELIITYQKSLNIYVMEQTTSTETKGDVIPTWAVYTIAGMLGFTACLASSLSLCWLILTVRQRHRLRTRQRATWESIVDEAENYAISLGCPMALISATHFLDFGCLTPFEAIRDAGKLRVLDTMEKIEDFQKSFILVFLSHRWLALTTPDPNSVHFETICGAVRRASRIANVSLDKVFLWVDFSSIPQDGCEFKCVTDLLSTPPRRPRFTNIELGGVFSLSRISARKLVHRWGPFDILISERQCNKLIKETK